MMMTMIIIVIIVVIRSRSGRIQKASIVSSENISGLYTYVHIRVNRTYLRMKQPVETTIMKSDHKAMNCKKGVIGLCSSEARSSQK